MKRVIFLLIPLLISFGCSKDNPNVARKKIVNILTDDIWKIEKVFINNEDRTILFDGMELTLFDGSYTSINGNYAWEDSGTWEFSNDNYEMIIRNDGIEVTIVNVSAANLTLQLYWDETTYTIGGRRESLKGNHLFYFRK